MHTDLLKTLRLESSGVPIYVQLREQILRQLGAGVLAAGDQMPTMREVAVALRIDINTVRHAYEDLERAGLITLARGRGSFVAGGDESAAPAEIDRLVSQTLRSARIAGINPITLANRLVALAQTQEHPEDAA